MLVKLDVVSWSAAKMIASAESTSTAVANDWMMGEISDDGGLLSSVASAWRAKTSGEWLELIATIR